MSYVLRYGGAIEESAHECDTALSLDPGNYTFRSCAFTFDQLGNHTRAMDFLQLDAGSLWSSANLMREYIEDGKLTQAREIAQKFNDNGVSHMLRSDRDIAMMVACMDNPSSADAADLARQWTAEVLTDPDPEVSYVTAPEILLCGQKDLTLRLVKNSIAGHYCASTGLQNDPAWAKVRGTPEFNELLSAAKKCQSDFLAQRSQAAQ